MAFESPHSSPYARLVANVTEGGPKGDCWLGEGTPCRSGYLRSNWRIPGLGGAHVHLTSHILTWAWVKSEATTLDELYLAYQEFRRSGLVLDHTCEMPACRNPDHLEPVTQAVNLERMRDRRAKRAEARGIVQYEPEPEEIEF